MAKNTSFCRHKNTFCMNFIKYSILTLHFNRKKDENVKPGKWIRSKKKKMRVAKATVHGNCCWEIRGKNKWQKQKIPLGTKKRGTDFSKVPKARAKERC